MRVGRFCLTSLVVLAVATTGCDVSGLKSAAAPPHDASSVRPPATEPAPDDPEPEPPPAPDDPEPEPPPAPDDPEPEPPPAPDDPEPEPPPAPDDPEPEPPPTPDDPEPEPPPTPDDPTVPDYYAVVMVENGRVSEGPDYEDTKTEPEDHAGGHMTFVATRDRTERRFTVDYRTRDGTAVAGRDYTAVAGTLTLDVGVTTAVITVAIVQDTAEKSRRGRARSRDDASVRFTLQLSNPVNGYLVRDSVPADITPDPDRPIDIGVARWFTPDPAGEGTQLIVQVITYERPREAFWIRVRTNEWPAEHGSVISGIGVQGPRLPDDGSRFKLIPGGPLMEIRLNHRYHRTAVMVETEDDDVDDIPEGEKHYVAVTVLPDPNTPPQYRLAHGNQIRFEVTETE